MNKEALYKAWRDINKKSAVGIDNDSAKEFGKNQDENLEEFIRNENIDEEQNIG
ncbi:hypothetical protein [Clostridium estertheticum]|uniref:hypothetical protein n=1 Tax=Clostridium estertheticum TaxID=238834 RepID=UPI001CF197D0|nr:hypothetical protein [Clostridium estertheticum]MCB2361318.1 hypothetical protein [Clostridium estertheticum]